MPASRLSRTSTRRPARRGTEVRFTEAQVWAGLGEGWQHLHGSFLEQGYSLEWHDFTPQGDFDWSSSFHPGGLEICLNLVGEGHVSVGGRNLELAPLTAGFYFQESPELSGRRAGGQRHQFITMELSLDFLRQNLSANESDLHESLRRILAGKSGSFVSEPIRLTNDHQTLVASLRRPPVQAGAQRLWYRAKALEVASALFYQRPSSEGLFCQRQKQLNQDRVQKVVAILREDLAKTPALEDIGRRVGCSHFHLSRLFSQETGQSIFQHLRQLRMDRAAELLREGRMNVTQVSLEVGYSSPSHFSMAFHEAFGCCPGLYPLATPAQRAGSRG